MESQRRDFEFSRTIEYDTIAPSLCTRSFRSHSTFDISILKSSCIYYSPKRSNEDGKERLLLRNCFIEKNSVLCFKLLFDNLLVTNLRNNILRTISSLEGDNNHGKMLESYARKASFEAIRRGVASKNSSSLVKGEI